VHSYSFHEMVLVCSFFFWFAAGCSDAGGSLWSCLPCWETGRCHRRSWLALHLAASVAVKGCGCVRVDDLHTTVHVHKAWEACRAHLREFKTGVHKAQRSKTMGACFQLVVGCEREACVCKPAVSILFAQ